MKYVILAVLLAVGLVWLAPVTTRAADDSKVKSATSEVERGAKKIGDGKIGEGVEETAKGIGNTVVEGSKYTGEKLKESGKAAEPEARRSWHGVRQGAVAFAHSVKNFFNRLFAKD